MTTSHAKDTLAKCTRRDTGTYLTVARKQARESAVQIDAFAQRVAQLPESEPSPEALTEGLHRVIERQQSELVLAVEELRAQLANLHEAHAVLEEERAWYADLFTSAPEAYVTTDARGVIREANEAAAALLGVARQTLRHKLLIAFVARRDVRGFRAQLQAAIDGQQTFSLKLRPRGGVPFAASLSVRAARRGTDSSALRWLIRPEQEERAEGERTMLALAADELGAALASGAPRLAEVAEDLESIARPPPAPASSRRSVVTPASLVQGAVERAAARSPAGSLPVGVGSLEPGVELEVAPERVTWALARLLTIVGAAGIRGWRKDASFVIEVRSTTQRDLASHRLAEAAVRAALVAEGGTLRVCPAGDDYDDTLVCEVTLPARASGIHSASSSSAGSAASA